MAVIIDGKEIAKKIRGNLKVLKCYCRKSERSPGAAPFFIP